MYVRRRLPKLLRNFCLRLQRMGFKRQAANDVCTNVFPLESLKTEMTNFELALLHVLSCEGGFVDNAADRGGPTNFGITLKTLENFRGNPATREDVKNLTREEAAKIYKASYWDALGLDRFRQNISMVMFDKAVNSGPKNAVKILQSVLNASFREHLALDGVMGPGTVVAVQTAPEERLCRKMIQAIQTSYVLICLNDNRQLVFLQGWMNRTYALIDAVAACS